MAIVTVLLFADDIKINSNKFKTFRIQKTYFFSVKKVYYTFKASKKCSVYKVVRMLKGTRQAKQKVSLWQNTIT